ncbi:hypothetical protein GCM10010176_021880 [Nonomuraea spiralis]|nr:hypothetical protein GCM10010176_021880 [Nonomuraea spiralis]
MAGEAGRAAALPWRALESSAPGATGIYGTTVLRVPRRPELVVGGPGAAHHYEGRPVKNAGRAVVRLGLRGGVGRP